jgi:hypothetical protein
MALEEQIVGKGLAASAVLVGLLAAGCASGNGQPLPTTGAAPPPAPTADQPKRTAPAKSLQLADKCSIVSEQQWRALGADQPPRARNSNGQDGCNYGKGKFGTTGWSIFVAAAGGTTFQQEAAQRGQPTKASIVAGYPVAEYSTGNGCVLFADISDQGHLIANIINNSTDNPGVDLCQQAEKFAQAAVQNLPNG